MSATLSISGLLLCLFGAFVLSACAGALRHLRRARARNELREAVLRFWPLRLTQGVFPRGGTSLLLFWILFAQNVCRFGYTIFALALLLILGDIMPELHLEWDGYNGWLSTILLLFIFFGLSLAATDLLPHLWAGRSADLVARLCTPFASLALLFIFPVAYPFLKVFYNWSRDNSSGEKGAMQDLRERILEVVDEAGEDLKLNATERKLITAAVTFRDRIVREVMVPRAEVFSIAASSPIAEAAEKIREEGYSRVPVYGRNIDDVIGVLMYRDVLALYMSCLDSEASNRQELLEQPTQNLVKPVFYVPETKKIADILSEFRNRQAHLAIVVDEYGATEGVVTIEDVLEEIVGEIADEYDEEEVLFSAESSGTWLVDARMTLYDVEEQLGFKIPQDAEYDTVGGYVFHRAGAIPATGFVIHHDSFDMEVVKRSDRAVLRVRIKQI